MQAKLKAYCTHCRLHAGLAGMHVLADFATGKVEIYGPMAVIYAVASWVDAGRH